MSVECRDPPLAAISAADFIAAAVRMWIILWIAVEIPHGWLCLMPMLYFWLLLTDLLRGDYLNCCSTEMILTIFCSRKSHPKQKNCYVLALHQKSFGIISHHCAGRAVGSEKQQTSMCIYLGFSTFRQRRSISLISNCHSNVRFAAVAVLQIQGTLPGQASCGWDHHFKNKRHPETSSVRPRFSIPAPL